ncbi:hypothetical protein KOR34_39620 [Posidoniimonas corsicana]|uniref:DUF1592 domain-containing protein n=1 Tax=Posidoniimonas corsicana TaxID=1938618 RepID=A0A5C5V1D1_9BACT|nr:DUF1592 domain-containing protein [Posidoniimonas corsicana]TWT32201.1 hypothetical protein KOR34_39620 [Posidoniimonas corsicana]
MASGTCVPRLFLACLVRSAAGVAALAATVAVAEEDAADRFRTRVLPVLQENCFDCHGWGAEEGGLALDVDPAAGAFLTDTETWWKVLKNVRAGVMPPEGYTALPDEAKQSLATWVKSDVFGIDPHNVDPGPSAVRRLNRYEYGNTIRDLMGIDYNVEIEFPPDDSGFGFDNVGDGQSLSPMLVEKYLRAAQSIVDQAVPTVTRVIQHQEYRGRDFRSDDGSRRGERMSVDDEATVTRAFTLDEPGAHRVVVNAMVDGSFEFHPRRCVVTFSVDGQQRSQAEYGWQEKLKIEHVFDEEFEAGEHTLTFSVRPLPLAEGDQEEDDFSNEPHHAHYFVRSVKVEGPLDPPKWQRPPNYQRFFTRDQPPSAPDERRAYAEELLERFAGRAFRRPVDAATVDRLAALAESVYSQPDKTFEAGVAHAMVAVLASPRFLLRADFPAGQRVDSTYPLVDEYSLASRLSYFFWSTMPDQELTDLAARGQLRESLDAQVERMLADDRSRRMVREFVGQWLRSRDVENVSIDALAALGLKEEYDEILEEFRRSFRGRRPRNRGANAQSPEEQARAREVRERFRELREVRDTFDGGIRRAMRDETDMTFEHIVREDRSVLELIDSDYTFLNEDLADFYGIDGVQGRRMRKVTLPQDSQRGGVLTQGTMLTVTSNPTRTSPVKRGLFILDNLLGAPPPPAPPGVPELEEAAEKLGEQQPTLREVLALHRESALCSSCHARMDPLGLALENFDAMGRWRDFDNGRPIDSSGNLVSGETFASVQDLKTILATSHRRSFYRCLTEKLFTYALGRGLDYYDVHAVDTIVDELDENNGRVGVLIRGVVRSDPFLRHRGDPAARVSARDDDQPPAATR